MKNCVWLFFRRGLMPAYFHTWLLSLLVAYVGCVTHYFFFFYRIFRLLFYAYKFWCWCRVRNFHMLTCTMCERIWARGKEDCLFAADHNQIFLIMCRLQREDRARALHTGDNVFVCIWAICIVLDSFVFSVHIVRVLLLYRIVHWLLFLSHGKLRQFYANYIRKMTQQLDITQHRSIMMNGKLSMNLIFWSLHHCLPLRHTFISYYSLIGTCAACFCMQYMLFLAFKFDTILFINWPFISKMKLRSGLFYGENHGNSFERKMVSVRFVHFSFAVAIS